MNVHESLQIKQNTDFERYRTFSIGTMTESGINIHAVILHSLDKCVVELSGGGRKLEGAEGLRKKHLSSLPHFHGRVGDNRGCTPKEWVPIPGNTMEIKDEHAELGQLYST